jgi:hypothetical protein
MRSRSAASRTRSSPAASSCAWSRNTPPRRAVSNRQIQVGSPRPLRDSCVHVVRVSPLDKPAREFYNPAHDGA